MFFASQKEFGRWNQLKILEAAGAVRNLRRQVPYRLTVNDRLVATYIADFVYEDDNRGQVVEDAKGFRTEVYKLKRKLMLAVLGIDIVET